MLAALEELTVDDKSLPYYSVYSRWILLQSWCTMRFSDHRGLKPSDVQVTGNTMLAKLTRSKTTGDDKDVAFRMVHISSCCYLISPSWLRTSWTVLKSIADFPRDFLLPALASNCNGCLRKELRYDIGSAMQNRVLSSLQFNGQCFSDQINSINSGLRIPPDLSYPAPRQHWEYQRTREITEGGARKEATAAPELQQG